MRIALFVHCFYPGHTYGTETYTLDLARNFKRMGHEPIVVSATFVGERPQTTPIHRYRHEGIPVLSIDKNLFPHRELKDTYYQPQMAPMLGDLLDEIGPDVVHVTHLVNHTAVLLEACAARRLPTIATFTDFFGFCYNSRLEAHDGELCSGPASPAVNCVACHFKGVADAAPDPDDWRMRIARHPAGAGLMARGMHVALHVPFLARGRLAGRVRDVEQRPQVLGDLYRHYARAIAPTAFVEQAYARNGFAPPIDRIPFGVDIDRSPKARRGERRRLVIGYVGQIMRHKGPDLLVDAARAALPADAYEIRIYGSPEQDGAYAARLEQRSAGAPVRFMGTFAPAHMRAILDELDVLVIPSRWYENSPLVLLNALASHTPVIVSNVEGMTEFVEEGVNGYTFERGSVAALAEVLARIRRSPTELCRLATTTNYDVSTPAMAVRTLAVYAQACAGAPAPQRVALTGTAVE